MIWIVEYRGRTPERGQQWLIAGPWWLHKADAITSMNGQKARSDDSWEWRIAAYDRSNAEIG